MLTAPRIGLLRSNTGLALVSGHWRELWLETPTICNERPVALTNLGKLLWDTREFATFGRHFFEPPPTSACSTIINNNNIWEWSTGKQELSGLISMVTQATISIESPMFLIRSLKCWLSCHYFVVRVTPNLLETHIVILGSTFDRTPRNSTLSLHHQAPEFRSHLGH